MAQNIKKTALPLLIFALLLASCASNKKIQPSRLEVEEYDYSIADIASLPAITPDTTRLKYLSSNIKLTLRAEDEKVSLKGKLRIQKDSGIQISIAPLGVAEMVCIEFLPSKVRFINKLEKTYTEVPYTETAIIGLSGINYAVLESIFLNRVFLANGEPAYMGIEDFTQENSQSRYNLAIGKDTPMQYRFTIDKANGYMTSCNGCSRTGENIICDYSEFKDFNGIMFPNMMCISFKGEITLSLDFEHSKLSEKEFKFSPRKLNSSYSKQTIEDFLYSI